MADVVPTPASGSTKGSDVLFSIKTRLQAAIPDLVRIVAQPNPSLAQYRAERCVALRFAEPNPLTMAGGGRYGMPVTRTLEVYVGTQNLLDQAGEDEALVLAHLDFEEQVINALVDDVPNTDRIAISVLFIPGGSKIEREVKGDPGMGYSVLLFEVKYQLAFSVVDVGVS